VIVVDANILVYLFLPSDFGSLAVQARRKDEVWLAPYLWRSEFRNALLHYVRLRKITLAQAQDCQEAAIAMMEGREQAVDGNEVLALAAETGCTAYDCEYAALARRTRVPLVTMDKQLLKAFPKIALSLREFCAGGKL
jgi:predicted nucleic acid-binding protein